MKQKTVKFTADNGLCTSCGICKSICPKECISWKKEKGMYFPEVDENKCVKCGICLKVCSGIEHFYDTQKNNLLENVAGNYRQVYNAWSKNEIVRHMSASGGVVTTLISNLLQMKDYDTAFCLDTYVYDKQLKNVPMKSADFSAEWKDSKVFKSRYLPVSHEQAVKYIKSNRNERVIIVGISCAIRGIRNVIQQLNLKQDNYLLIGLFCDKVFNYNIHRYFENGDWAQGKTLNEVHFKNKESGGWPGNMKLFFNDGSTCYLDKNERGKVKEYFMPERCLYCVDKLNVAADISLGDNYTKQNSSVLGSNSVIIRTEVGLNAWGKCNSLLESKPVDIEKIMDAQYLEWRTNNLYFAQLKQKRIKKQFGEEVNLNKGLVCEGNANVYERSWKRNQEMLHAGEIYDLNPKELQKQMKRTVELKNPKNIKNIAERGYYFIKRKIHKS